MKVPHHFLPILLIALLLQSCGGKNDPAPKFSPIILTEAWKESTPGKQNVDSKMLQSAVDEASDIERMRSLLVVRNGKIISEHYFGGADINTLHDVRSVTKSIVATLVLIALERGDLSSLDKTIVVDDLYTLSSDQQKITYRHLLEMSSGFEWDEWTSTSYNDWIVADDEIQSLLDLPHVADPGTSFTYNSGAVHLLGHALSQEVGMSMDAYAQLVLFGPLQITEKQWEMLYTGANGGAGIDLRARDLARFGQLYLQEGWSGEDQIISADHVNSLTSAKWDFGWNYSQVTGLTYGQLWWGAKGPVEAYMAWGYGGQYVVVAPSLKMVVVTTTNWRLLSTEGGPGPLEMKVMDMVYTKILAAAK